MEDNTREIRYMRPRMDAGGEGTRGGKIIGHTSSGKPIYGSHGHPSHGGFTKDDHFQAAKKHEELVDKHNKDEDRHAAADRRLKEVESHELSNHHNAQMVKHHKSAGSKIDPKTARWVKGNKEMQAGRRDPEFKKTKEAQQSIEAAAARFKKRGFDKPGTTTVKK